MRILIADDQPKVRFALRVALERQQGLKTVSEALDAEDALTQATALHPDLILLDWELPGMSSADLIARLRRASPQLRVVVLSGRQEARQAALGAGADTFVSKGDPPEGLLSVIGDCWREMAARRCGA